MGALAACTTASQVVSVGLTPADFVSVLSRSQEERVGRASLRLYTQSAVQDPADKHSTLQTRFWESRILSESVSANARQRSKEHPTWVRADRQLFAGPLRPTES